MPCYARMRTALATSVISLLLLSAHPGVGNPQAAHNPSLDRLVFREIGPASAAGRIDDFAVLESNPAVFYVATATGGLWKTANNGTTFESVFDNETTSSIGDVAIAPQDANLIWVGTGENNNRQSSSWGDGVYKSADGGRTWKNMGLESSRQIGRIIVDPVDHEVVYVAALGSLWGPGGHRGVYKTTDGGTSWSRVLNVDENTGATELVMDPSNNKVLYAATYQRQRATWGFNGGGPGSAIYKTADAGRTWIKLSKGIPEGPLGRIGLDIYRKNPNVLYARIEHERESGVYRSDDAGASWVKLSDVNPRPMYFSQIRIDPNDDHRIYVLGVQLHVSDDGGRTFRDDGARKIHVDFHAMWINPANSNHLMIGGDGGVGISYDRSQTYVWLNNMPIGQFYHVSFDMRTPYYVCGGLQDNNTWCGPSAVRTADGIVNDDWFIIGGGDGFVALIDPADYRILYSESQNGRMNRVDLATNERKSIRPESPDSEEEYRWNWNTPIQISPHNPSNIFVAANRVFKSTDRGHSWQVISPDLTANTDREELKLMGVAGKDIKIAKNDGVSSYGTLVSFAESPATPGLYYTGSDDGLVQVSRDGGKTWSNVTGNIGGLPPNTYVSRLEPSRFDEATVYGTFDGHQMNDFGTYVYVSRDYGASWQRISGDLPEGEVVRTIAEDLKNPEVLYLGTERGLYATFDRGARWTRIKANLPTVPVYEITLHPRDNAMLLATHGRSVWIMDDMTPLQQFSKAQTAEAFLFTIPTAVQRRPAADRMKEFEGDRQFLGRNPEAAAVLTYHLQAAAKDLSLTILDAGGVKVREFTAEVVQGKTSPGINRHNWDLRVEPLPRPEGLAAGGRGSGGGGLEGPMVLPGSYEAVLKMDGREAARQSFTVSGDPDIKVSDADRRAQFDTLMELHRLQKSANDGAVILAKANEQLSAALKAVDSDASTPAQLKKSVEEMVKKLEPALRKFGVGGGGGFGRGRENVRGQISQLKGSIMASSSRPTEIQAKMAAQARGDLEKAIGEANALLTGLPALFKELADRGIYPSVPGTIAKIR